MRKFSRKARKALQTGGLYVDVEAIDWPDTLEFEGGEEAFILLYAKRAAKRARDMLKAGRDFVGTKLKMPAHWTLSETGAFAKAFGLNKYAKGDDIFVGANAKRRRRDVGRRLRTNYGLAMALIAEARKQGFKLDLTADADPRRRQVLVDLVQGTIDAELKRQRIVAKRAARKKKVKVK